MTPTLLLTGVLIVGLASSVQAAVGFGLGMTSVPLLLWAGFTLPQSVSMVLGAALTQLVMGLYDNREHIDLAHSAPIVAVQTVAVPVGIGAMSVLAGLGKEPVQQAVGAAVLLALLFRHLAKPEPREHVPPWWGWTAGAATGFLAGMVGMGGPPMVFYALFFDWPKEKFRVFLWTKFVSMTPVQLVLLTWTFGSTVLVTFAVGLCALPIVYLAQWAAVRWTDGWSTAQLQTAVTLLLAFLGVSSLLRPLL